MLYEEQQEDLGNQSSIDRSKYLSPPVSPEPKLPANFFRSLLSSQGKLNKSIGSSTLDTSIHERETLLSMKERDEKNEGPLMYIIFEKKVNLKRHKKFLASYGFEPNGRHKIKTNQKSKQKISNLIPPPSSSSSGSQSSEETEKDLPIRQYLTRSKRPRSQDLRDNEVDSKRKDSSPTLVFKTKLDFLQNGTYQNVHDFTINSNQIPDFIPKFDNKINFEMIVNKVLGTYKHELKDKEGLDLLLKNELAIVLALKLSPLQYLDTKKRLFAEKARKTYLKTTFKKTDAQKVCRIDVNKASKLFEVFQMAGLLEDELFKDLKL